MRERLFFAGKLAIRHLLVSLVVAGVAAVLVYRFWYPFPTAEMLNVSRIYGILLAVDVVCGPLLTCVMANPRKSRRELAMDLALVGLIQLGALGYGLHALEASRPVAIVFEVDRLVVVGKNELYEEKSAKAERSSAFAPWSPIRWAMLKSPTGQDKLESLDLSLQGVSPARRPSQWLDWNWADPQLQAKLKPLTALSAASKHTVQDDYNIKLYGAGLRFIPLVSGKNLDWIAVFDDSGKWVDSLPVDGF